jgi:hypothetical protein
MIHLRAGRQYRARLTGSVRWLVGPPDAIFLYKPESLVCGCPYSNWEKLKFLLGSQRTPTHLRFVIQNGVEAKSGMIFSFSSRKQRGIVRTFGKCPIFRSPRNDRLLPVVMAERVCFGGETGLELARRSDRRF